MVFNFVGVHRPRARCTHRRGQSALAGAALLAALSSGCATTAPPPSGGLPRAISTAASQPAGAPASSNNVCRYLDALRTPTWAAVVDTRDSLRYDHSARHFGSAGRRAGRRFYRHTPDQNAPVPPLPVQRLPNTALARQQAEVAYAAGFRYQLRHEAFRRRTAPVVTPEAIGKAAAIGIAQSALYTVAFSLMISLLTQAVLGR